MKMKILSIMLLSASIATAQNGSLLLKWRAAFGASRANISDARIAFVGDSTTAGNGGQYAGTNPSADSFPYRLAQRLASQFNAVAGMGVPPATASNDTRWSAGGNWTHTQFGAAYGAGYVGTSGNLVVTMTVYADQYYVYMFCGSGQGTSTITATGGTPVVTNNGTACGGASTFRVLVGASGPSSSNTVTITPTGTVYVVGVEPILSSKRQLLVGNLGVPGVASGAWLDVTNPAGFTGFGGRQLLTVMAPNLVAISLGVNDCATGVATSTNATVTVQNVQTIVLYSQAIGADVLIMGIPPNQSGSQNACQSYLNLQLAQLANSMGVAFFDTASRFGYAWQSSLFGDATHPNDAGYYTWADGLQNLLIN